MHMADIFPLKIVVLGAGNIGGTLGRKWSTAGHQVTFGVSDPNGPLSQALRAELGDKIKIGTVADALITKGVPFIFATGYGERGLPESYRGRPVLQKPFARDDLERLLKTLGP